MNEEPKCTDSEHNWSQLKDIRPLDCPNISFGSYQQCKTCGLIKHNEIAEILCKLYCTDIFREKCKANWKGPQFEPSQCLDLQKSIKAILALIEREQAKHNTTRWYIAKKHYDEGIETQEDKDILSGAIDSLDCTECMKQAKESIREEFERREKPMREALGKAKAHLKERLRKERNPIIAQFIKAEIAQIDSIKEQ